MKYVGAHVAAQGGVGTAPLRAAEIGANTFALFTANQRTWRTGPVGEETARLFATRCREAGFDRSMILPHDSYLINLGATDGDVLEKSREAFLMEIRRCEELGIGMINFHPGAHKGRVTDQDCLRQIAAEINRALEQTNDVVAVVEVTAGQGSNVGYRLEHLADLIDQVRDKSRIGVCLDTCHLYAAGYDIREPEGYAETMTRFEEIVGLSYLRGMHLNDSQHPLGSRKDRHARLGHGTIGWDAFRCIVEDPRTDDMPLILETPEQESWREDIARLRQWAAERAQ